MGMKERLLRFRSFWCFPLLAAALLSFSSSRSSRASVLNGVQFMAAGLLLWTLLEYCFHRFLLHARFHNPSLNGIVNSQHLRHHEAPRDQDQILVQLPFALVTSAVLYALFWAVTRDIFAASGVISGIWLGFLYYEAVHYRVHLSLSHSPILQQQRRAHFYHHFLNSEKCFGVTSPLWDYVFGTRRREVRQV